MSAVSSNNFLLSSLVINRLPNLNIKSKDGYTAIMLTDNIYIIKLLID